MKHKSTNTVADFQTFTLEQIQQSYRNTTGNGDYKFELPEDTPETCQEILEVLAKDGQLFPVEYDGIYYAYFAKMMGFILFTVVLVPHNRVYSTTAFNNLINANKTK